MGMMTHENGGYKNNSTSRNLRGLAISTFTVISMAEVNLIELLLPD